MKKRSADTNLQSASSGAESQAERCAESRLNQLAAMLTAQSLITETLIHALCFENIGISRTRIVNTLDLVYEQLEEGLGGDNETVKAFSEQRDSLRSLLVASVIWADLQMRSDLESTL